MHTDETTGATVRLKEGQRVYCDKQQFEGTVLRDEEWGEYKVPVLVYDDTDEGTIMMIHVDELTAI